MGVNRQAASAVRARSSSMSGRSRMILFSTDRLVVFYTTPYVRILTNHQLNKRETLLYLRGHSASQRPVRAPSDADDRTVLGVPRVNLFPPPTAALSLPSPTNFPSSLSNSSSLPNPTSIFFPKLAEGSYRRPHARRAAGRPRSCLSPRYCPDPYDSPAPRNADRRM